MDNQTKNVKTPLRNNSTLLRPLNDNFNVTQSPYTLKLNRMSLLIRSNVFQKATIPSKKISRQSKIFSDSPSSIIKSRSETSSQESSISISSHNANFFQERLESRLEELSKSPCTSKERLKVFLEFFDEIKNFLTPFTSILSIIKQGILYNTDQASADADMQLKYEKSCEKYEKTIANLSKDKSLLIKKLNTALSELHDMTKAKEAFAKCAESLEKKVKFLEVDCDKVHMIENLNKQSEIIHRQTKKIESMMMYEIKMKKIIEKLINCRDMNLTVILDEVKEELENSCA
ncbi:hypothetical protein SteCoe_27023 [Stentor coeruleus]|uniref:Uncharacterized protein n=1 Tax=Stentor coeruleus TaxID=5963 RepID=A0A1R2BBJ1_9CILI|nr:hypothetical protein SteCoe_27023 [Stentor coeruleus]